MNKKQTKQTDFRFKVNRVVQYIRTHLDEKMDINTLAEICAFSPFHFHRIIKAYLGEPIGAFVVRQRVERAAWFLCYSEKSISEIAYSVGYDTPSSLTKAFVKFFGISPTKYRKSKNYQIMKQQESHVEVNVSQGEVLEIPAKRVIYCSAVGDYKEVDYPMMYAKLWQEVHNQRLFSDHIEHLAIYYDNPQITLEENLRCNVCLSIDIEAEPKDEIGVKIIEGGRFVVFKCIGEYHKLGYAYDKIYRELLPKGGWELRDNPGDLLDENNYCFEKYVSNPQCTPPEELITEIYIAIE